MVQVYRGLVAAAARKAKVASSLRGIFISSGDIDPVVALHGTEAAVHAIGFPVAEGGDRRPWFYNSTATPLQVLANKPVAWGQTLHAQEAGPPVGGFVIDFNTSVSD